MESHQPGESLIEHFPCELVTIICVMLLGEDLTTVFMRCRLCCKFFNKAGTIALARLGAMSPLSSTPTTIHQNFFLCAIQNDDTSLSYFYVYTTHSEHNCVIVKEAYSPDSFVFVAVYRKRLDGASVVEFVYQRSDSPGIYYFCGKFLSWTLIKHGLNSVGEPMFHKAVHLERSQPAIVTCDPSVTLHSWPISGYVLMECWNWADVKHYGEAYLDKHNVAQIRLVRGMSPEVDSLEYRCRCHNEKGVVSFHLTNYSH
jgi:hypothetical protein